MLIDTKIVKQFGFFFCGHLACVLIAEYTESREDLDSINKHYPVIKEFMEWSNSTNHSEINQEMLNNYYTYLFGKYAYAYANVQCSYIKSFFKFLMQKGYCEFITFSTKPKKPKSKEEIEETFPNLKRVIDYYKFLGVDRDADVSEIKKSYYALALKYHPDVNQEDPQSEKRIKSLNTIYSTLKNPETRLDYDIVMGYRDGETVNTKITYTVWI